MIQRYALVNTDLIVVNVCLWDGNLETWQPEPGIDAFPISDDAAGGTNDRWDPDTHTIVPNVDG